MGKIFNRLLQGAKIGVASFTAFYAIAQTPNLANNVANSLNPSKIRHEFRHEFGTEILGWNDDVEYSGSNVSAAAIAFSREWRASEFNIAFLRIEPRGFWEKSFWGQYTNGAGGYFFPTKVSCTSDCYSSTLIHEIKHAKTFDVIFKDPSFLVKWMDAMGFFEFKNRSEVEDAFVSDYAKTNVFEDIAEFTGFMETILGAEFVNEYKDNEFISKRLELAIEYGLTAKEFPKLMKIVELYHSYFLERLQNNFKARYETFSKECDEFLNENPSSNFEINVREMKAFSAKQLVFANVLDVKEAVELYKDALKSGFKDPAAYNDILHELLNFYSPEFPDKRTLSTNEYKTVVAAIQEYDYRLENGDIYLSERGVNDFLEQRGFLD